MLMSGVAARVQKEAAARNCPGLVASQAIAERDYLGRKLKAQFKSADVLGQPSLPSVEERKKWQIHQVKNN